MWGEYLGVSTEDFDEAYGAWFVTMGIPDELTVCDPLEWDRVASWASGEQWPDCDICREDMAEFSAWVVVIDNDCYEPPEISADA